MISQVDIQGTVADLIARIRNMQVLTAEQEAEIADIAYGIINEAINTINRMAAQVRERVLAGEYMTEEEIYNAIMDVVSEGIYRAVEQYTGGR